MTWEHRPGQLRVSATPWHGGWPGVGACLWGWYGL